MTDSLYGLTPDPAEDFGVNLGVLAPRGERNVLIASLDALLRASSSPFFPYMIGRIEEGIDGRTVGTKVASAATTPMPPGRRETGDADSRWTLHDVAAFVLSLIRDRSDTSSAPP
jgi:hypothetical protein